MNLNKLSAMLLVVVVSGAASAAEWKNPDAEPAATDSRTNAQQAPLRQPASDQATVLLQGELGLDVQWACNLEHVYNDKGSGGEQDVKFYLPASPPGYRILGGYAQGNHHGPDGCVLAVKPANQESAALLQPPAGWRQVWTDRDSGARMDGSIWQAMPGSDDFVCLGGVARQGYAQPSIPQYTCVHQCLVESIPVPEYLWSDRGTGARQEVSVYRLLNSNSFFAQPSHSPPRQLLDLRRDPVCKF